MLLLAGVAGPAFSSQEAPLLPGFTATYEARALGSTLTVTKTLRWNGSEGELRLRGRIQGLLRLLGRFEIDRVSTFRQEQWNILLLAHHNREITPGHQRNEELRTEEGGTRLLGSVDGKPFQIDTAGAPLDFLTTLHWARLHLAEGTHWEEGVTVDVIDRGQIRTYHMQSMGEARLSTPMGSLNTIQINREDRARGTSLSAWFAPSMTFLPVRIDYRTDGRTLRLELTTIDWL